MDDTRPIDDLIECARMAGAARLVVASGGNISVRLPGGRLAISTSGARLDSLHRGLVTVVPIETGDHAVRPGGPGPSIEVGFHRAVYQSRDDAGAVLHFQAPAATALACAKRPVFELDFIPEVPAYVGTVATVPFHHPGTSELAEAVGEAAARGDGNVIVLLGHGQIALGTDPAEALRNAEVFELACDVALRGIDLRRYDAPTLASLRRYGHRWTP